MNTAVKQNHSLTLAGLPSINATRIKCRNQPLQEDELWDAANGGKKIFNFHRITRPRIEWGHLYLPAHCFKALAKGTRLRAMCYWVSLILVGARI